MEGGKYDPSCSNFENLHNPPKLGEVPVHGPVLAGLPENRSIYS